ncbi:hypothetical protein [Spirochaeta lutea]|uniref:hypothetical protein n=1 Tax=Spirochaeta lutea TaxID=1480694 RepID=UPI000A9DE7FB|nr:hypothetical protein [Spirochaeta lutea]
MSNIPEKPDTGFIKQTDSESLNISSQQRVALVRRGNELFNDGQIEAAKRIFLTLGYSDGLIRVGDRYFAEKRFLEALRLYILAPDRGRISQMAESMALVVRTWMLQDNLKTNESLKTKSPSTGLTTERK